MSEEKNMLKSKTIKNIINLLKKIVILVLIVLMLIMVLVASYSVVDKSAFEEGEEATAPYTKNATVDAEKGIVIKETVGVTGKSNTEAENIFKNLNGAKKYLKDDAYSTKEEKLEFLMNAELVTKFPYISSIADDSTKLNGVVRFYRFTDQIEEEGIKEEIPTGERLNPKSIFYIGDYWIGGLQQHIKSIYQEYPGDNHFWYGENFKPSSAECLNNTLKTKIDAVNTDVSKIVIMLGLNAPIATESTKMNGIIDFLSNTYPDKDIYVLKVPYVGKEYLDEGNEGEEDDIDAIKFNLKIDEYNSSVSQHCLEKENVRFLDTTSNLLTEDLFLHEEYKDGEIKLNSKGNSLWYQNIKVCIEEGRGSVDIQKYEMIYVNEEDFDKMIDDFKTTQDKSIFKYFTINRYGEIVVATWKDVNTTITTDDPDVKEEITNTFVETEPGVYSSGKYTISKTKLVHVEKLTEKYAMPFNLLWAFLIHTEDYLFVSELAALAYNTKISVGIYDDKITRVQTNTETYNKSIQFTENASLLYSGMDMSIWNNAANSIISKCIGAIEENKTSHTAHFAGLNTNTKTSNDGELYKYFISDMNEEAVIQTISKDEGHLYKRNTVTTTKSANNPAIGAFYVNNWVAEWDAKYIMELDGSSATSTSGAKTDEKYESLSVDKISETLLDEKAGTIGMEISPHAQKLKQEAIAKMLKATEYRYKAEKQADLQPAELKFHINNCLLCQKYINQTQGKTLEEIKEEERLDVFITQLILSKNYEGTDAAATGRKKIYSHAYNQAQQQKENEAEAKRMAYENTLKTSIKYTQWPTAEKANVNINYSIATSKNPYKCNKDETEIENEGIKFKEIINKQMYNSAKESILKNTEWFWDYIRSAEDTRQLEDALRLIFNIAFNTNQFGNFSDEEIEAIFDAFEPESCLKTQKITKTANAFGCNITREDFIRLANSSNTHGVLHTYAEAFYDICTLPEYNVNPCLAYAWAGIESGFGTSAQLDGTNNLFQYGTYNGMTSGKKYNTIEESIHDFCKWVVTSSDPATSTSYNFFWSEKYATVNNKFNGDAKTNMYVLFATYGVLYEDHCPDSRGCINIMYMFLFNEPGSARCDHLDWEPTTLEEKAYYVQYTVESRVQLAKNIFGATVFTESEGYYDSNTKVDEAALGIYTASSGRSFTEWRQGASPYGSLKMFDINPKTGTHYTMGQYGCNVYAITTLLTSVLSDIDPGQIHTIYKATGNNTNIETIKKVLTMNGITSQVKTIPINDKEKYISELEKGRGIATWLGTGFDNLYTTLYHWTVVADIRPTELGDPYGYDVYVLTSGTGKGHGWHEIETILDNFAGAASIYIED